MAQEKIWLQDEETATPEGDLEQGLALTAGKGAAALGGRWSMRTTRVSVLLPVGGGSCPLI